MKMPDSASIRQYLKNPIDTGGILKLHNRNYKVKDVKGKHIITGIAFRSAVLYFGATIE